MSLTILSRLFFFYPFPHRSVVFPYPWLCSTSRILLNLIVPVNFSVLSLSVPNTQTSTQAIYERNQAFFGPIDCKRRDCILQLFSPTYPAQGNKHPKLEGKKQKACKMLKNHQVYTLLRCQCRLKMRTSLWSYDCLFIDHNNQSIQHQAD